MFLRIFQKPVKEIATVEALTLRIMNMRDVKVYQILCEGKAMYLQRFREYYIDGAPHRELEKSVSCEQETLVALLNRCGAFRWDGFHGKHPRDVCDGTMFTFTASVDAARTIRADGSENFPKGYREFVRALNEMLAE